MAAAFSLKFLILTSLFLTSVFAGDLGLFNWMPPTTTSACQGSLGECLGDEEFGMDSESNRRILATTQYVSYGALQRNKVPCSQRGASYYNCQSGAQANPYSRGCSQISRCRTS